jgi:hypothetical protein
LRPAAFAVDLDRIDTVWVNAKYGRIADSAA